MAADRPELTVESDWRELFEERNQIRLEAALQDWLPSRRWFAGKARTIRTVHVLEIIPMPHEGEQTFLTFLQVDYVQTDAENYVLPLACPFGEKAEAIRRDWPQSIIARIAMANPQQAGVLHDAITNKDFCKSMLDLLAYRRSLRGGQGEVESTNTAVLRKARMEHGLDLEPRVCKAEQSNSSVIYGERFILKFFRRLDFGVNPELEIGRFLQVRRFPHSPPLAGGLEYRTGRDEPETVGILTTFVPGCKDAWEHTLDNLGRFYERVQTLPPEGRKVPATPAALTRLGSGGLPENVKDFIGTYAESADMLGARTAALHLALASETEDKNFAPEPFTPHAQRGFFESTRAMVRQNFQLLSRRMNALPPETVPHAKQVLGLEADILGRFRAIYSQRIDAVRIRIHGDYHLGQVLYTGKDFLIIDFEGEPERSLGERRLKHSPLADVAGMMRSFHYASYAALEKHSEQGALKTTDLATTLLWGRFWVRWVSALFYRAYREAAGKAPFLPANEATVEMMMDVYLLRKAVYELGYELNDRPQQVGIPIEGILELMGGAKTP